MGIQDAGDQVRGTWPRSPHADTNIALDASVAVRHVGGGLLVAHQDVMHGVFMHLVVQRHDRAARDAEDDFDALLSEAPTQDLRAVQPHPYAPLQFWA